MPAGKFWTPQQEAELEKYWGKGSALQIANRMGFTRSAICGKAKRMGLMGTAKHYEVEPVARKRAKSNKPRARAPAKPKASARPRAVWPTGGEPCTLIELDGDRCHWPLGEMFEPAKFFCGAGSAEGLPYCPDHCAIAYQTKG